MKHIKVIMHTSGFVLVLAACCMTSEYDKNWWLPLIIALCGTLLLALVFLIEAIELKKKNAKSKGCVTISDKFIVIKINGNTYRIVNNNSEFDSICSGVRNNSINQDERLNKKCQ